MVVGLNLEDFIPYLGWLDFQGIKSCIKKIDKTFNEFARKIIEEHVNVNNRMAMTSNGRKET